MPVFLFHGGYSTRWKVAPQKDCASPKYPHFAELLLQSILQRQVSQKLPPVSDAQCATLWRSSNFTKSSQEQTHGEAGSLRGGRDTSWAPNPAADQLTLRGWGLGGGGILSSEKRSGISNKHFSKRRDKSNTHRSRAAVRSQSVFEHLNTPEPVAQIAHRGHSSPDHRCSERTKCDNRPKGLSLTTRTQTNVELL